MAVYNQINNMILKLRELGRSTDQIADDIAPELKKALESNISSGQSPDGIPWEPTADGQTPLQGASKALQVTSAGSRVLAVVGGIYARHNDGRVRGGIKRQIIPTGITEQISKIINDTVNRHFKKIMGK